MTRYNWEQGFPLPTGRSVVVEDCMDAGNGCRYVAAMPEGGSLQEAADAFAATACYDGDEAVPCEARLYEDGEFTGERLRFAAPTVQMRAA